MSNLRKFKRGLGKSVLNHDPNTTQFKCSGCGAELSIKMPPLSVFGDLRSSAAVAALPKPVHCMCGKYYALTMEGVQASWAVLCIPAEEAHKLIDSKLVLAPATALVQ
jgi:hypothetical protein